MDSESTFGRIELHLVLSEDGKGFTAVRYVVNPFDGFDDHIIHVAFNGLAEMVLKHVVDQFLISGLSVLQSKRHGLITIQTLLSDEGCVLFVPGMHGDLMIPLKGIHEAQQLVPRSGVHEFINLRQRKAILRAFLIEVGEVDTYSSLPICLFNEDHVG